MKFFKRMLEGNIDLVLIRIFASLVGTCVIISIVMVIINIGFIKQSNSDYARRIAESKINCVEKKL